MERSPHVLVVDDDREICSLLTQFLARHGIRVSTARDGVEMFKVLEAARIDLIVLDLMLPGDSGLNLCRRLRASSDTPVIMLTAMGEEIDRIVGLEIGADDYLPKPFNPRELLARIKAVIRRVGQASMQPKEVGAETRTLSFDDWRLEVSRRQLIRAADGSEVPLSSGEFDLLLALAERPQRVLTRDQLLDITRGRNAALFDRSIDIQVMRLRRKIEPDPKNPQLIKTVRSGGYILACPVVETGGDA